MNGERFRSKSGLGAERSRLGGSDEGAVAASSWSLPSIVRAIIGPPFVECGGDLVDGIVDVRVLPDTDDRPACLDQLTIECKNALRETYKDGDAKVETQKTRDSGAGRKYPYDAFDIVAACMFSVTGRWTFKFKWASDLRPWSKDPTRIGAIQRIDATWSDSIADLLA